jgi:hypothetical protein
MVIELALALAVTVVPLGIPVPETDIPTKTGPKSPAEVTVTLSTVVVDDRTRVVPVSK